MKVDSWSRGFHRRSLVDERQLYQKSDKVVPLVFRFSPGLGSFLSPLPLFPFPHRHQRPQACVSTGQIKVTRLKTAAKAANTNYPTPV